MVMPIRFMTNNTTMNIPNPLIAVATWVVM